MRPISSGAKIGFSVCIFLVPIVMLGSFLYLEKKSLIDFTNREIAGVRYIEAAHTALLAVTHASAPEIWLEAKEGLLRAEKQDTGFLQVSDKTHELANLLQEASVGNVSTRYSRKDDCAACCHCR